MHKRVKNKLEELGEHPEGKVSEVRKSWQVFEDGAMAYGMQEDEFKGKKGSNQMHAKTRQKDIPVAKLVQSEEEETLQKKQFEHMSRMKQISDADAVIAQRLTSELMIKNQQDELVGALNDEQLALKLQKKEQEEYELKLKKRELARERKRVEKELSAAREKEVQSRHVLASQARVREDGKVEDEGDFSDFYISPRESLATDQKKALQEMQDQEIARLLQDQEHKRGGSVYKNKLIEERDEELARIIQEQEKLKLRKKKHFRSLSTPSELQNQSAGLSPEIQLHLPEEENLYASLPDSPSAHRRYARSSSKSNGRLSSSQASNSAGDHQLPAQNVQHISGRNVIASIDPTFLGIPDSLDDLPAQRAPSPPPLSSIPPQSPVEGSDLYLSPSQSDEFSAIAGHRRETRKGASIARMRKDSKSCKQQ